MKRLTSTTILIMIPTLILLYTIIGTSERVDKIKELAPSQMKERNWRILRYEGFEYGSWYNHGGKVWYHVANLDNPNIQYRVYITMWSKELQYYYHAPEELQRININYENLK